VVQVVDGIKAELLALPRHFVVAPGVVAPVPEDLVSQVCQLPGGGGHVPASGSGRMSTQGRGASGQAGEGRGALGRRAGRGGGCFGAPLTSSAARRA